MRSSISCRTPREGCFGTGPSRVFGLADAPPLGVVSRRSATAIENRAPAGLGTCSTGFPRRGMEPDCCRIAHELLFLKRRVYVGANSCGCAVRDKGGCDRMQGPGPDPQRTVPSMQPLRIGKRRARRGFGTRKATQSGRRRCGRFSPVWPVTRSFGGSKGARLRLPESEAPQAGTPPRLRPFGVLPQCPP